MDPWIWLAFFFTAQALAIIVAKLWPVRLPPSDRSWEK